MSAETINYHEAPAETVSKPGESMSSWRVENDSQRLNGEKMVAQLIHPNFRYTKETTSVAEYLADPETYNQKVLS